MYGPQGQFYFPSEPRTFFEKAYLSLPHIWRWQAVYSVNSNNSTIPALFPASLFRLAAAGPLHFPLGLEGPRLIWGSRERKVDAGAVLHATVRHVEPDGVGKLGLRAELVQCGKDVGREFHRRLGMRETKAL